MEKPKRRLPDGAAVALGLVILLAAGVWALLCRGGEFSEQERRYLADFPGTPDVSAWKTDRETERFLADHIPARGALVAADSGVRLLTGRNSELEAWVVDGSVVEPPVKADAAAIEKKLSRFAKVAEAAGAPWVLLTPRTHGWLLREKMTGVMARAFEEERENYDLLDACPNAAAMPEAFFSEPEKMYYRTDHHWTLEGAYQAYLALAEPLGYEPAEPARFRVSEYGGFRGTTLSRSGLPPLWQDTLVCAEPDSAVTMTAADREGETKSNRLIFPERAEGWDGYAVYLDGNHGTLVIERPDAPEGTLVVYKDSMANCLLPLLSMHFRRIVAVDARYDAGVFTDALARAGEARAVLYVYSLDSLVNDTEIIRKAR